MLNVCIAQKGDEERMSQLYQMARAFMASRNLKQWQSDYPAKIDAEEDIKDGVARVLKDGELIVGTSAFVDYEPDYEGIYDGKWMSEGEYLAVHRVAVDTSFHGKGYAGLLFSAAMREAKERGKNSVRIDTHEQNKPMRRALEKSRFVCVGKIRLSSDGTERVAYEKVL